MNVKETITKSLRQNTADQDELLEQVLVKAQKPVRTHPVRRLAAVALCGAMVVCGTAIAMHKEMPVPEVSVTAGPGASSVVHEITLIQFNGSQEDATSTSQVFVPGVAIKTGAFKIDKTPSLYGGGYGLGFAGDRNAIRVQADGLQSVTFSCDTGEMRYVNLGAHMRNMKNYALQIKADINAHSVSGVDMPEMKQIFDEYIMAHASEEAAALFSEGHLKPEYTYGYTVDWEQTPAPLWINIYPVDREKVVFSGQELTVDSTLLSEWDDASFSASWWPSREMLDRLMQDGPFSYADDWGTNRITITCNFTDGSQTTKYIDAHFDEEGNQILELLADS